eukprot:4002887-Prymnesium_polylepis.2
MALSMAPSTLPWHRTTNLRSLFHTRLSRDAALPAARWTVTRNVRGLSHGPQLLDSLPDGSGHEHHLFELCPS